VVQMLRTFMDDDREFQAWRRRASEAASNSGPRPLVLRNG